MAKELKEFQQEMCWTNDEMIAQFCWAMCVGTRLCAEEYELEEMAKYDAYCDAWENSYC